MITERRAQYFTKMRQLKPICDKMADVDINNILDKAELAIFHPMDFISRPNRPSPAVYIILEGSVLVSRSPTWGDHPIYFARRRAGTFVGEVTGRSLLRDLGDPFENTHFAFTGITRAETECEMLQVKHEDFNDLIERGGIFAVNVVRCMAIKVLEATDRIEFLKHRSAVSRIADELLHLRAQQGGSDNILIPMSMKEFAWWLDLEPPTLSRSLKDMEKAGLIIYHTSRRSDSDIENKENGTKRQGMITLKDITRLFHLRENDSNHSLK